MIQPMRLNCSGAKLSSKSYFTLSLQLIEQIGTYSSFM